MNEDYEEPSFDDQIDERKRAFFLDRLGPAMPLTKRSYGPSRLEIFGLVFAFFSIGPIAVALKSIL
jgi:hypothetical protein